jgi:negative regulator of flagellin synthesis FlgM
MSSIPQLSAPERLRATTAAAALRKNALNVTAAPAVSRQPDGVSISDSGRAMASARTVVSAVPDTREDRINALKAAVADGTYSVDSRRLATAMVRSSGN